METFETCCELILSPLYLCAFASLREIFLGLFFAFFCGYSDSLGLISPEPDCVAFLVDSSKLASRGLDHQTKPFGFAFDRVEAEGSVLHVHFGARQNVAANDRGHINEVTVDAIGCPYDSTDWCPFIGSTQGRDGHCHQ
jgi:hypothetical protein